MVFAEAAAAGLAVITASGRGMPHVREILSGQAPDPAVLRK